MLTNQDGKDESEKIDIDKNDSRMKLGL